MTYVDDMQASFRGMVMCHMIADTDEELHAMADLIGMKRQWHQCPPAHASHYDIALSKRALAVAYGAVEITIRQASAMTVRRRITGQLGPPDEARSWVTAWRDSQRQVGENAEIHAPLTRKSGS